MSFASALTQALNIFSVVIDQALCIFGEKSAWGKKSAWEPDSQDPAYYAGLLDSSLLQAGKPSKTGDEKGAAPTADCQAEDGSALSGG